MCFPLSSAVDSKKFIEVGHDESEGQNASGDGEKAQAAAEAEEEPLAEPEAAPDQEMEGEENQEQIIDQVVEEPQMDQEEVKEPAEDDGQEQLQEAEPEEESKPHEEELKLEDLEEVVKIYDAFRALRKKTDPSNDKALEKEFEQKMSEMANGLKKALSESQSAELSNACILKARHDVLDITFGKLAETVPDKLTADLWKNIRKEHNLIVQGLLGVISKIRPAAVTSAEVAANEVAQAQKETHEVLEAAKHLESEMQKHVQEKEELRRQFEAEKKELQAQIASLEEENKKYLDTIIKRSKMAGVPTPMIGTKDSPLRGITSADAAGANRADNKKLVSPLLLVFGYITQNRR